MRSFADALRVRAKELGLTNAEVARRADLTERRYGNYVTGVREPDLATLGRIAGALRTTPDTLLGFAETNTKSAEQRLLRRLLTAAAELSAADIEGVIVQVEALVAHKRKKRRP
jgi:transcriptional regulator with XRE-family HTH domain